MVHCLFLWLILIQGPRRAETIAYCEYTDRPRLCRHVGQDLTEIPAPPNGEVANYDIQYLQLTDNIIDRISNGSLQAYPNLLEVFLDSNMISVIEVGAFHGLKNLRKLYLNRNHMTSLHNNAFRGDIHLQELDVSDNKLYRITNVTFFDLIHLKHLHLRCNKIVFIAPGAFSNCRNLTRLDLSSNRLSDTSFDDDVFHGLISLHEIDLSNNVLSTVPPVLFLNLSKLHKVFLSGNNLITVDMKLWPGERLHSVYLTRNLHLTTIRNVPESVLILDTVAVPCSTETFSSTTSPAPEISFTDRTVTLCNNTGGPLCRLVRQELAEIPAPLNEKVANGTKYLRLSDNIISKISNGSLRAYPNLETLSLDSNRISVIEEGAFFGMKKLKVLHLNQNHLTQLNGNAFHGAVHLRELDLSNNRLYMIKGTFVNMTDMTHLQLGCNSIKFISPGSFSNSHNLTRIDLSSNNLSDKSLRLVLHELSSLREIDLSDNDVRNIPSGIFLNLIKLEKLVLSGNNLTAVDMKLWPSERLHSVYLGRNLHLTDVTNVPESVRILEANVILCSAENLRALKLIKHEEDPCPNLTSPTYTGDGTTEFGPEESITTINPFLDSHSSDSVLGQEINSYFFLLSATVICLVWFPYF